MICELPRKINPRATRDYEVFIRVGTKREILPDDGDKSVRALHWPFKAAAASENFFVTTTRADDDLYAVTCLFVQLLLFFSAHMTPKKQFQARDVLFAPTNSKPKKNEQRKKAICQALN